MFLFGVILIPGLDHDSLAQVDFSMAPFPVLSVPS